jgi:hypothetical protein
MSCAHSIENRDDCHFRRKDLHGSFACACDNDEIRKVCWAHGVISSRTVDDSVSYVQKKGVRCPFYLIDRCVCPGFEEKP